MKVQTADEKWEKKFSKGQEFVRKIIEVMKLSLKFSAADTPEELIWKAQRKMRSEEKEKMEVNSNSKMEEQQMLLYPLDIEIKLSRKKEGLEYTDKVVEIEAQNPIILAFDKRKKNFLMSLGEYIKRMDALALNMHLRPSCGIIGHAKE